jgi:hypothetical protein
LTGHPVEHQGNLADLAAGTKVLGDEILRGVIRKVANVQTIRHFRKLTLCRLSETTTPPSRTEGEIVFALNETSALGVAREV